MQRAPIPKNEAQRLKSLLELGLLDTPSEARFDRITTIATKLFQVPISTLTLIDANREWFKSVCGLPSREGDRAISFCGHALVEDDLLVILDTKKDVRFQDNPMVIGKPYIRFYAGVPLFSADGQRVGVFCIKSHKPRAFSKEDREMLKSLAAWAELEMNQHNVTMALSGLKQSIFELDTFFHTADDFMCIAGTDGYFKRVNPVVSRALGYSEEELLAKPFFEFVHPDDLKATKLEVKKLKASRKTVNFLNRYRKKDGTYLILQWNATPHDKMIYAIARDVTVSVEREKELETLNRAMVDREMKMIELKQRLKKCKSAS